MSHAPAPITEKIAHEMITLSTLRGVTARPEIVEAQAAIVQLAIYVGAVAGRVHGMPRPNQALADARKWLTGPDDLDWFDRSVGGWETIEKAINDAR